MKKSLLLIDGNSIVNRAYFGLAGRNTMSSADGTPTGALYAFMNIYLKHIQDLNPTYICSCFDLKAPTFRHLEYKEYKATRKPMPQDLVVQIPILKEIMDAMGIPRIEMEGFEADDLIGSLSKCSKDLGLDTYILSGDKDDLQLVDENTIVLMPLSRNGQTTTERFDVEAVVAKYRIKPIQFIDLKALMGDPSDNIPGVRGIGEKGATDLIVQYNSLDQIYQSLDEIKPSVAEKLKDSKEIAYLSKWLATIKRDIPIKAFLDEIHTIEIDKEKTYKILHRLGFRSIIQRLQIMPPDSSNLLTTVNDGTNTKDTKEIEDINKITNMNDLDDKSKNKNQIYAVRKISIENLISIITKTPIYKFSKENNDNKIIGIEDIPGQNDLNKYITEELRNLSLLDEKGFISFVPVTENIAFIDCGSNEFFQLEKSDFDAFFEFVKKEKIRIVSLESKSFLRNQKINSTGLLLFDVFVAGYLLSQAEGKASLDRIAEICLGQQPQDRTNMEIEKTNKQQSLFEDTTKDDMAIEKNLIDKAIYDVSLLHLIAKVQYNNLKDRGLEFLAMQVEMPLIGILAEMERLGFAIDQTVLSELNEDLTSKIANLEELIYAMAGITFNINSPKQLGEVLFKKLMLPTGKKTQNGFSTNSDVLDMLYDKHPIIKEIGTYRQLSKLRSTFIEGLSKNIDPVDKRVHTTFNQTLTTTGRLSSSEPNLQNIPVKQEIGREIRKAFVASEGNVLVDADYSQIELRLLAELSKDTEMLEAFRNNDDIHMNTAEEIFDLPREMITPTMRSAAKTINFSIVYGISDFGLAQDLGVTLKEAHSYISEYYKKYPGVKIYLESLVKEAYENGYVETLFHRRRHVHELKSANRNLRMFGERVAMNTPVQGTAADIIKIAMILVSNKLNEKKCNAKLVLQVHDELILEVPENEADAAAEILKEAMESAVHLSIPFIAEVKVGKSWYNTK